VAGWPWNQWPDARGMGGRITVESVVRCSWNGWPDDRGIRSDYLTVAESVLRKGVRHFAHIPPGVL